MSRASQTQIVLSASGVPFGSSQPAAEQLDGVGRIGFVGAVGAVGVRLGGSKFRRGSPLLVVHEDAAAVDGHLWVSVDGALVGGFEGLAGVAVCVDEDQAAVRAVRARDVPALGRALPAGFESSLHASGNSSIATRCGRWCVSWPWSAQDITR